jgi:hypothetical protein
MKWLMSRVHLPTLDQHILDLPYMITDRGLWFWEFFKDVVENSLFNVYDPILKRSVRELYLAWQTALSHSNEYHSTNGRGHVFSNPMDLPLSRKQQKAWDEIETARTTMQRSLNEILERLRSGYIEINLRDTNTKAWKDYVDFENETQRDSAVRGKPQKPRKKK